MTIFQFETKLENGIIKIPKEYEKQLKTNNLIKVTIEEENPEIQDNYLQYLLQNPLNIENLKPMKRAEIYEDND